jgi:hypothetical protein
MSIVSMDMSTFKQDFKCDIGNKERFGEVITDFVLVNRILDLLPESLFLNPVLKWLDPCAGKGYFPIQLYIRLFDSLRTVIKEPKKRHRHIIEEMIYMIELNPEHIPLLFELFGENANIMSGDFLEMTNMKFDIIIGNPPFNMNGIKKAPTNKTKSKKSDGVSIWTRFLSNSISNLKTKGYMAMITPSIWLKRDYGFHSYLLERGEMLKMCCMTNTETNRIFHKQAQTPTVYFAFHNDISRAGMIKMYDLNIDGYVSCNTLKSIPLISPNLIKRLNNYVEMVGSLKVIKTSMRVGYKGLTVTTGGKTAIHPYENITTCILYGLKPRLVINQSNIPCSFKGVEKLVLAHKMYGFPYYDKSGEYGISNRDNYVITDYTSQELVMIKKFLETKLALAIFETTRYRMTYLERYAFEFIPDITKLNDFPKDINDDTLNRYFGLTEQEKSYVQNISNRDYLYF